jgi:hypothetical protein
MIEPLTAYLTRYAEDPDAFAQALDTPVIIYEPTPELAVQRVSTFQLHAISKSGYMLPVIGPFAQVQPVRQKEERKDARVTLGRTPENDVVIDDASVSRLHAWLEWKSRGGWHIADAGSRNGTVLNSQRLSGKKLMMLGTRATLGFGDVSAQFLCPEDFLEFLHSYHAQQ